MATLHCQHVLEWRWCPRTSKLLDGQRRFCRTHHRIHLRDDPEFKARADAYNADPELVAARAAGGPFGSLRRFEVVLLTARTALERAENAARERQQPGIVEAERAAVRARAGNNVVPLAARAALIAAGEAEQAAIDRLRAAEAENAEAEAAIQAANDRAMAARAEMANANDAVRVAAAALVAARAAAPLPAFGAAAAAAAARRNAVRAAIQVFARDPPGGINLRAMAADNQSVHRSGVVSAVEAAIHRLCERPLAADQRTLAEAQAVLPTAALRDELQRDFNLVHGFDVPYAKVLDHVWGVVRAHEHRRELQTRFVQEMRDGREMCHTGKMTRLVNVLAGFDDAVGDLMPPAELFRNRIALLADRPLAEREPAARDLFREFAVPEAEQAAWLEPLIEA